MRFHFFLLLIALYPIAGHCCSCVTYPVDRYDTFVNGVCHGDVYSGVVLEATCTCRAEGGEGRLDCRQYSYSEEDGVYSEEVLRRVDLPDSARFSIKNCTQAEDITGPGETFQPVGSEPGVETLEDEDTDPLICPFNDEDSPDYVMYSYVCTYQVRVTEVFVGNFSVGDVITTNGPDAGTSCSPEIGRILQLRSEYLAGVGGPCSDFNDWGLLSTYTDDDLDTLRELAEDEDMEKKCSGSALYPAAVLILTAIAAAKLTTSWL